MCPVMPNRGQKQAVTSRPGIAQSYQQSRKGQYCLQSMLQKACATSSPADLNDVLHHPLLATGVMSDHPSPACKTGCTAAWALDGHSSASPQAALPAPPWLGMTCCALPAEQAAPQCWPRGFGGHRGHAASHHCARDRLQPGICAGEHSCPGCPAEAFRVSAEPSLTPHVPWHRVCLLWSCLPKNLFRPGRSA